MIAAQLRLDHQEAALEEAQRLLFEAASIHDEVKTEVMIEACAILVTTCVGVPGEHGRSRGNS